MKKMFFVFGLIFSSHAFAGCDENGRCEWDCSPDGAASSTCTATFENGTLVISGTEMKESFGEVRDPQRNNNYVTLAPWRDHIDDITNFVIDERIDTIGAKFLTGATQLKSIVIPDHVTTVGRDAFAGSGAEKIVVGDNLKTLEDYAFWTSEIPTIYCRDTQAHSCVNLLNTDNSHRYDLAQYSLDGNRYIMNGNRYRTLSDMQNGVNQVKRIYTIKEANEAAGKKNKVMIRYK